MPPRGGACHTYRVNLTPGIAFARSSTAALRLVKRCILRNMPKVLKDKRHRRNRHNSEPAEYRLLTYAALGQIRKVVKLFDRHADLDVNFYDAHGHTALHQVKTNDF